MPAIAIALVLAQAAVAAAGTRSGKPAASAPTRAAAAPIQPAATSPVKPVKAPDEPAPQLQAPLCSGDYADALPAEQASSVADAGKDPFVFAIRNTATYEHLYYGRDGKLRRA